MNIKLSMNFVHLLVITDNTSSRIEIRKWVERMVNLLESKGLSSTGPTICDSRGVLFPAYLVDAEFKAWIKKGKGLESRPTEKFNRCGKVLCYLHDVKERVTDKGN